MPMKTIPLEETEAKLTDVVSQAARRGTRTVITRHGEPVAAIVSVEDLEALEDLEDREAEAALTGDLKRKARRGGTAVPLDEVLRRYGLSS